MPEGITQQFTEQGLLGSLCVVLFFICVYLFKALQKSQQDRFSDALEVSKMMIGIQYSLDNLAEIIKGLRS